MTRSIPGLPGVMKEYALEESGWKKLGDKDDRVCDILNIDLGVEKGESVVP